MIWGVIGTCAGLASVLFLILGYVTKFAKLETKTNLMWTLYVEDRLKKLIAQGDMKKASEAETTDKGEQALSDRLKRRVEEIALKKKPKTLYDAQLALTRDLDLSELDNNAQTNPAYTIGELALLAAGYMVKMTKSHSNSPN